MRVRVDLCDRERKVCVGEKVCVCVCVCARVRVTLGVCDQQRHCFTQNVCLCVCICVFVSLLLFFSLSR